MKREKAFYGVVLTALLIGLAALVFNAHSAAAAHIWPMFRHDLEHTGRSPYYGPQASNLLWACELSAGVRGSSPAIAQDGTIYIGTVDGNLQAVNPNTATIKWSCPIGGNVYSSPAIGSDGTIYVGSWRETGSFGTGAVYAINPTDGSVKWRYPDAGYIDDIESSPAIDPESGVIYVGGSVQHPWDGRMYAIYPNGDLKCDFFHNSSGWITASPAIMNDGTIIIGDYNNPDGRMWAIDPTDCSALDFVEVPNPGGEIDIFSSAALDSDRERIYFGGSEGNANISLWAYDFELNYVWHFPTNGHVPGSPAIGSDGTIYVGSYDDNFYAIDPDDGTEKWHYTTGGNIFSSPAVGADGVIYFGSHDNNIYALNENGSLLWSYPTGGAIYSSPAIASNILFVASTDGYLYAIGGFCRINPSYIDFGIVLLEGSAEETFIITNDPSNDDPLYLNVSESADYFRIASGGGPYTLYPGESREVTVCFEPSGAVTGTRSCTIEIGDDVCCDVYCTGVVPNKIAPGSIGFGTVIVGSYKDMSFDITNNKASGTLSGFVNESSDIIEIVSGGGAYFLGPGESVTVTVRCRPYRDGPFECKVDTGNSSLRDVRCYGEGKVPRDDKRDIFLDQNKPNPFNPVTEIEYSLPVSCRVKLVVYNILGQTVATLVDEYQSAGSKVVRWDGRDDNGLNVVSGVYFYRLQAGRSTDTKKMVLLR